MTRPLLAIRGITVAVDLLDTFRLSRPADQRAPVACPRAVGPCDRSLPAAPISSLTPSDTLPPPIDSGYMRLSGSIRVIKRNPEGVWRSHRGPHGSEHWAVHVAIKDADPEGPQEWFQSRWFTSARSRTARTGPNRVRAPRPPDRHPRPCGSAYWEPQGPHFPLAFSTYQPRTLWLQAARSFVSLVAVPCPISDPAVQSPWSGD